MLPNRAAHLGCQLSLAAKLKDGVIRSRSLQITIRVKLEGAGRACSPPGRRVSTLCPAQAAVQEAMPVQQLTH
jgi:hypothetical protein